MQINPTIPLVNEPKWFFFVPSTSLGNTKKKANNEEKKVREEGKKKLREREK